MPLPAVYKDNISTVLPKADYGIKISKAGYDAITAADNDLLYDSSWPSMQIVKVVAVTAEMVAGSTPVLHGLEFPPVAFVLNSTRDDGFHEPMVGQSVDERYVFVTKVGTLVIYNVDISTDIEYPYTAVQSVNTTYNPDYGVKMIKPGESIDSTDLRDYILHSRCGSPLVLAVKTEETVNPENPLIVQYTSKIGYPTLNFGYIGVKEGGGVGIFSIPFGKKGYFFAPQGGQSYPIAFTNGFTVYVNLSSFSDFFSGKGSVISLRSPMFANTNTVVDTY